MTHHQQRGGAVFVDRRDTPEMALWNLLFLTVLAVGVGCAVSPALEQLLTTIAAACGMAGAAGVVVRWGCRWVRERAEDRAHAAHLAQLRTARVEGAHVGARAADARVPVGRGR